MGEPLYVLHCSTASLDLPRPQYFHSPTPPSPSLARHLPQMMPLSSTTIPHPPSLISTVTASYFVYHVMRWAAATVRQCELGPSHTSYTSRSVRHNQVIQQPPAGLTYTNTTLHRLPRTGASCRTSRGIFLPPCFTCGGN